MDENPYEAPQTKPLSDATRPNRLVVILRRYALWFGLALIFGSSLPFRLFPDAEWRYTAAQALLVVGVVSLVAHVIVENPITHYREAKRRADEMAKEGKPVAVTWRMLFFMALASLLCCVFPFVLYRFMSTSLWLVILIGIPTVFGGVCMTILVVLHAIGLLRQRKPTDSVQG
jgi:hypothetical protein